VSCKSEGVDLRMGHPVLLRAEEIDDIVARRNFDKGS